MESGFGGKCHIQREKEEMEMENGENGTMEYGPKHHTTVVVVNC